MRSRCQSRVTSAPPQLVTPFFGLCARRQMGIAFVIVCAPPTMSSNGFAPTIRTAKPSICTRAKRTIPIHEIYASELHATWESEAKSTWPSALPATPRKIICLGPPMTCAAMVLQCGYLQKALYASPGRVHGRFCIIKANDASGQPKLDRQEQRVASLILCSDCALVPRSVPHRERKSSTHDAQHHSSSISKTTAFAQLINHNCLGASAKLASTAKQVMHPQKCVRPPTVSLSVGRTRGPRHVKLCTQSFDRRKQVDEVHHYVRVQK